MTVMLWATFVIAALLWASHFWAFVCEWGRGTMERVGGFARNFWMYTFPAPLAAVCSLLGLIYAQGEQRYYTFFILAPVLVCLGLSVWIQVPAYRRLRAAEREQRQEMARRMAPLDPTRIPPV